MRQSSIVRSCIVLLGLAAIAPLARADQSAGIAPIQSSPHGKSYGEWAAAWWQWALETPASVNPVLDTTGANCAVNQEGNVWFLAGSFGGGAVSRSCSVPAGTALFLPLANSFYGGFLTDPPETLTEEFLRSQVTCIEGAGLAVSIDGRAVKNPSAYLEKSALFDILLPEDNVFGVTEADVPELTLSPVADEGYYLFLNPLPPGQHQLHFSVTPGSACAVPLDVTYTLTVGPH